MLFDFRCENCSAVSEHLVPEKFVKVSCPYCKGTAHRIISPVKSVLDGTDPGFPDAYDKWARDHEKAGKQPTE